jgi:hypothetical protein
MKKWFFTKLISLLAITIYSQSGDLAYGNGNQIIQLKKTDQEISLDGILDEEAWFTGREANSFYQNFPTDSLSAKGGTEIYMTYDDVNLYVGVICHTRGNSFVITSLRRDYSFRASDNISLMFDTFNDRTNAFLFGINPFGVRREALISGGGRERDNFNSSWDNKWAGESKMYKNYWIAELAIPFKTIRFQENGRNWRFQCYRNDTQFNETTSWIRIPRNNSIMDLAFSGEMQWDQPLQKTGKNISIIPFMTSSITRDFENFAETKANTNISFGGDAKISITSGLNLDLTVNPDFSQVEVDEQVTNLDRFEIFFPEKRQFFLENADLFGSFGGSRVNPFFSRRIGVSTDTATGQNIQNRILYGARLSGKINEKLRVGLLNMQTAEQLDNDLPSFNYTVAAAEHRIFSRSNLAFIFVNKQAFKGEEFNSTFSDYNRVAGLEYRLASKDNYWQGKATYHQAITTDDSKDKFSHMAQLIYNRRKFRLEWSHLFIGDGYNPEVGFVPQRDIFLVSPEVELNWYPRNSKIVEINAGFDSRWIYKLGNDDNEIITDFKLSERNVESSFTLNFENSTRLEVGLDYFDLILLRDFDPTRIQEDEIFLPAGSSYSYTRLSLSYSTDARKKFSARFRPSFGNFYNGKRTEIAGSITYRYQPFGFVSIDYRYNNIKLPAPFEKANLWLIGPRVDLTFSKKLFLTGFFQYNSQLDNLNINTRLQWRFKPVSDFFLVYTDNYITDPFDQFSSRNRALVAKVSYWLNL